jgi:SAM-dependent methyltransferase
MDVFGSALTDVFNNNAGDILWIHNNYDEKEEMPVDVFFRSADEMPPLETLAMNLCKGKILDAGAGAGSHSLVLQNYGHDVTALEISGKACSIMQSRGIRKVINQNFYAHDERYDTILLLMNGLGLAGSLENLGLFLDRCSVLLNPEGRILFDSSDISYLYQEIALPENGYFGDIKYCYEYKNLMGNWFDWLYIDMETLSTVAEKKGWTLEILFEDEHDQYLGMLQLK